MRRHLYLMLLLSSFISFLSFFHSSSNCSEISTSSFVIAYKNGYKVSSISKSGKARIQLDNKTKKIKNIHLLNGVAIDNEKIHVVSDSILIDESSSIYAEKPKYQLRKDDVCTKYFCDTIEGKADSILVSPNRDIIEINKGTYSTCKSDILFWRIHSKKSIIDRKKKTCTGYRTWIDIQHIPVFYVPYIEFSIDNNRKNGFLVPSIQTSANAGTDISFPYYFNIANNMDATLYNSYILNRGFFLT